MEHEAQDQRVKIDLWLSTYWARIHSNSESLKSVPTGFFSSFSIIMRPTEGAVGQFSRAMFSHRFPSSKYCCNTEKGQEQRICSFLTYTQMPKNFFSKAVWYESVTGISVTDNNVMDLFHLYSLGFWLHKCTNLKQISRAAVSSYLLHEKIDCQNL